MRRCLAGRFDTREQEAKPLAHIGVVLAEQAHGVAEIAQLLSDVLNLRRRQSPALAAPPRPAGAAARGRSLRVATRLAQLHGLARRRISGDVDMACSDRRGESGVRRLRRRSHLAPVDLRESATTIAHKSGSASRHNPNRRIRVDGRDERFRGGGPRCPTMNERLLYASSFEFGDSASRTLPQHQKPPMWLQHEQQPPMRCAQCDTARARIDALEHELSSAHARIASLERQLVAAQQPAAQSTTPHATPRRRPRASLGLVWSGGGAGRRGHRTVAARAYGADAARCVTELGGDVAARGFSAPLPP